MEEYRYARLNLAIAPDDLFPSPEGFPMTPVFGLIVPAWMPGTLLLPGSELPKLGDNLVLSDLPGRVSALSTSLGLTLNMPAEPGYTLFCDMASAPLIGQFVELQDAPTEGEYVIAEPGDVERWADLPPTQSRVMHLALSILAGKAAATGVPTAKAGSCCKQIATASRGIDGYRMCTCGQHVVRVQNQNPMMSYPMLTCTTRVA